MKSVSVAVGVMALLSASANAEMQNPDYDQQVQDLITLVVSDNSNLHHSKFEQGRPALHAEPADHCHGQKHLCSPHGSPVLLNAGHHLRAQSNSPIIGVLTQPMPEEWYFNAALERPNPESHLDRYYTKYFESSHADFLQAAGARVMPIDY